MSWHIFYSSCNTFQLLAINNRIIQLNIACRLKAWLIISSTAYITTWQCPIAFWILHYQIVRVSIFTWLTINFAICTCNIFPYHIAHFIRCTMSEKYAWNLLVCNRIYIVCLPFAPFYLSVREWAFCIASAFAFFCCIHNTFFIFCISTVVKHIQRLNNLFAFLTLIT